jgi:hypothetical protein
VEWPARYQWAPLEIGGSQIVNALRRYVPVAITDLPQPYPGNILTRFVVGGRSHEVALDLSDRLELDRDCVARAELTFKYQYQMEGYDLENVVPGGYIPFNSLLYRMLPYLRKRRYSESAHIDVNGRFGVEFAQDVRRQAMLLLSRESEFGFDGGLNHIRYSRYLRDIAQSRVCVDLPGNGPFCYRLVEYMAIGACVVAYPHRTRLHVPLVDGKHIAYVRPDLGDLVERCTYYVKNDQAREEMASQARRYFNQYLHRDQLAAYYLHTVLRRVGGTLMSES